MFFDKPQLIDLHESEFAKWEQMLAGLRPAQIVDPSLADGLSVKDTLAHLQAWQSRTIARLEGALQGHAPHFPQWPLWHWRKKNRVRPLTAPTRGFWQHSATDRGQRYTKRGAAAFCAFLTCSA